MRLGRQRPGWGSPAEPEGRGPQPRRSGSPRPPLPSPPLFSLNPSIRNPMQPRKSAPSKVSGGPASRHAACSSHRSSQGPQVSPSPAPPARPLLRARSIAQGGVCPRRVAAAPGPARADPGAGTSRGAHSPAASPPQPPGLQPPSGAHRPLPNHRRKERKGKKKNNTQTNPTKLCKCPSSRHEPYYLPSCGGAFKILLRGNF